MSASFAADIKPLDLSFITERGVFDDVEESFVGLSAQDCVTEDYPRSDRVSVYSWGLENQCSSRASQERGSPSIEEMFSLPGSSSSDGPDLEEQDLSRSSRSNPPSIEDMLDKSIEECREGIFHDSYNYSMSGDLFDMMTSRDL